MNWIHLVRLMRLFGVIWQETRTWLPCSTAQHPPSTLGRDLLKGKILLGKLSRRSVDRLGQLGVNIVPLGLETQLDRSVAGFARGTWPR